jgi:hypothetical protein
MLTAVRTCIHERRQRREDRAHYDALNLDSGRRWWQIEVAADHGDRARLLGHQARTVMESADVYLRVHGRRPSEGDGMDMWLALRRSALVLRQIADAETAIAYRRRRSETTMPWESAVGPLLDRMVAEGGMSPELRAELGEVVKEAVCWHAGAIVSALPIPPAAEEKCGEVKGRFACGRQAGHFHHHCARQGDVVRTWPGGAR